MHQRKGIVLMMTLGFIAVITALILWSVSISKSRFDKVVAIDDENQFSLVFKDFVKLIRLNDINSSQDLEYFLAMDLPPIVEEKTKIALGFSATSMMDKLNINYILATLVKHETNTTDSNQDEYLRRPLEKFFRLFELSNPYIMSEMLLSVHRGDSEIALDNFDFREGKIYDFNHFKKIRDYYYKSTHDANIFKITKELFDSYFYFGEPDEKLLLDCNSLEVSNAMGLIVNDEMMINDEIDICNEANSTNNPAMKTLNKIYNISQFANKKKYLVKCILNLDVDNRLREISFDYDVSTKRISNIDKNFQE